MYFELDVKSQLKRTEWFPRPLGWLGAGGGVVQKEVMVVMVKHGDRDERYRDKF